MYLLRLKIIDSHAVITSFMSHRGSSIDLLGQCIECQPFLGNIFVYNARQ
jgi:hypothetical protein